MRVIITAEEIMSPSGHHIGTHFNATDASQQLVKFRVLKTTKDQGTYESYLLGDKLPIKSKNWHTTQEAWIAMGQHFGIIPV